MGGRGSNREGEVQAVRDQGDSRAFLGSHRSEEGLCS